MAVARTVELAGLLREILARTQALGALYRGLATVGQPAAIRPPLGELASAKRDMARELQAAEGAIGRDLRDGIPPAGAPEPDSRMEGPLDGLRGEGLAAAYSAERSLQSLLKEAVALADGSPAASAVDALADQAADHRRRVLGLYQRYS